MTDLCIDVDPDICSLVITQDLQSTSRKSMDINTDDFGQRSARLLLKVSHLSPAVDADLVVRAAENYISCKVSVLPLMYRMHCTLVENKGTFTRLAT